MMPSVSDLTFLSQVDLRFGTAKPTDVLASNMDAAPSAFVQLYADAQGAQNTSALTTAQAVESQVLINVAPISADAPVISLTVSEQERAALASVTTDAEVADKPDTTDADRFIQHFVSQSQTDSNLVPVATQTASTSVAVESAVSALSVSTPSSRDSAPVVTSRKTARATPDVNDPAALSVPVIMAPVPVVAQTAVTPAVDSNGVAEQSNDSQGLAVSSAERTTVTSDMVDRDSPPVTVQPTAMPPTSTLSVATSEQDGQALAAVNSVPADAAGIATLSDRAAPGTVAPSKAVSAPEAAVLAAMAPVVEGELAVAEAQPDDSQGLAVSSAERTTLDNTLMLNSNSTGPTAVIRPAPVVPGPALAMQQPSWSEGAVERVMWISSQNLKSAEIQLSPASLGHLAVRIDLSQDQATQVTFISPHAEVRDAIDGQSQRLREMFTQQGMNLTDVNVADQSFARSGQEQGQTGSERSARHGRFANAEDDEVVVGISEVQANTPTAHGQSVVDYYA